MAEYQGKHATSVDEYGNLVSHGTGMQGGYGTTGMGTHGDTVMGTHGVAGAGAGGGQFQPVREEHKTGGILHRSGSSSSSSSEDDGEGGRKKKGIKEKLKEKLPGGHKNEAEQNYGAGYGQVHTGMAGTNTGGYGQGHTGMAGAQGTTEGTGEKKGLMEKIKEKLPGQH